MSKSEVNQKSKIRIKRHKLEVRTIEFGSLKQGVRNQKSDVRGQMLDIRRRKSEIRNQKTETSFQTPAADAR